MLPDTSHQVSDKIQNMLPEEILFEEFQDGCHLGFIRMEQYQEFLISMQLILQPIHFDWNNIRNFEFPSAAAHPFCKPTRAGTITALQAYLLSPEIFHFIMAPDVAFPNLKMTGNKYCYSKVSEIVIRIYWSSAIVLLNKTIPNHPYFLNNSSFCLDVNLMVQVFNLNNSVDPDQLASLRSQLIWICTVKQNLLSAEQRLISL